MPGAITGLIKTSPKLDRELWKIRKDRHEAIRRSLALAVIL
jgi:hypothetical protein